MRIVKLNGVSPNEWLANPLHRYCGRFVRITKGKNKGQVWRESPLHNPFKESADCSLVEAVSAFEFRLRMSLTEPTTRQDAPIIAAMEALTDDCELGCWCVNSDSIDDGLPEVCHCQVTRRVFYELVNKKGA